MSTRPRPVRKLRRVRLWHCVAALLIPAAATLCWFELTAHSSLPLLTPRSTFALYEEASNDSARLEDQLLQELVRQCMQQQDTFIWLEQQPNKPNARQHVAVWDDHQLHLRPGYVDAKCALLHIPLASSDRSIGLCTDAALYVQLLGGWIAPATSHGLQHAQKCGYRSAVMFLEPLYEAWLDWLQQQRHIVAVYAPNFEQMFGYDKAAHQRMGLVLCKVRRCQQLMEKYLEHLHSTATTMFTGHTSIDPQALGSLQQLRAATAAASLSLKRPRPTAARPAHTTQASFHDLQAHHGPGGAAAAELAAAVQPLTVLHVRGKSGLKHTKQLLDCWLEHPDWPQLTVIGPMPNEQITGAQALRYMAAPNIHVPHPGKPQGPNWPEFDPLPAAELSLLMQSHAVHIMPSEREGFGHSINEGRAAGAVLLVPDHPPMNELVREGAGILLQPRLTFSHQDPPVPVLGAYGNISASMSAQGICDGMLQALNRTPSQLTEMGRKARALFEADRAEFVDNMAEVAALLRDLLQVAEAAASGDATLR